jgi:hypothetical protein
MILHGQISPATVPPLILAGVGPGLLQAAIS